MRLNGLIAGAVASMLVAMPAQAAFTPINGEALRVWFQVKRRRWFTIRRALF